MVDDLSAASAPSALVAITKWRRPWRRRDDRLPAMDAWLESFSPDSYLPMLRLVERRDAGFLTLRCGPAAATKYRRLQRRVLKEYLHALSRDFHRLQALMAARSLPEPSDPRNASLSAVEAKMDFIFSMWDIELRLFLSELIPGVVDLRPLLREMKDLTAKAREVAHGRPGVRESYLPGNA